MAIEVGNNTYPFVQEVTITVGDLTGVSTKTVTATVPGILDITNVPVVVTTGLPDLGIGILHAWFSNALGSSGTTLNIKLSNTALATAVLTDPVVFKVVVL